MPHTSPDPRLRELWTPDQEPTHIVDWDSTACSEETLDFVAGLVLSGAALDKFHVFTAQGMGGSMPFSESLTQRFALMRARREHIEEAGRKLVALLDETALARREAIEANSDRIHVVSGGFEELIMPSIVELGIRPDHVHANRFIYDEDGFVIGADPDRLTSRDDGKALQVAALELEGLKVVTGDGYNDYLIKALGHADIFIAYTRHQYRANVVALADATADSFAAPLLS